MNRNKQLSRAKWGALFALLLVLVSATIYPVQAAEFDNDGIIAPDEVIDDDVFLNGAKVRMDGTINGTLVAIGETIDINGTVNGDVFAFGAVVTIAEGGVINGNLLVGAANVMVSGEVSGSVAVGASSLTLKEDVSVGNNLYFGGYSLNADPGSVVGKDLYAGVYQAILNGRVERDASISAGAIELSGSIGRNASFEVASSDETILSFNPAMFMPPQYQIGISEMIQPGLRVADTAQVGGQLSYTSPENQQDQIEAQPQGGIVFRTPVPDAEQKKVGVSGTEEPDTWWARRTGRMVLRWVKDVARNLISLLILGGLAVWLLPALLLKTSGKAGEEPLPAAGHGFLVWLVGYVGTFLTAVVILSVGLFLSLITIGGLGKAFFGIGFSSLGLAFSVFLLLVSYGSKLVVVYLAGDWVLNKLSSKPVESKVWPMVLGVVMYVLLRSIPFIGWIIGLVVTVIGLGAMWLVYKNWRSSSKMTDQPGVAATLPESGEEPAE